MSAHAFLAPSSASRWVKCAFAPTLEAAYPETEESPKSLEGSAAHWVVEMLLRGTPVEPDVRAPNGVAVTGDMIEGAEMVRDDIALHLGDNWQGGLFIEQKVSITRVHPDKNWGTPDYYAWKRGENKQLILHIWDYKYGHDLVEAFENWQLIDYVAGLLDTVTAPDTEIVVDFGIIQPRGYRRDGPVRHWRVLASELRGQINILAGAAGRATGPDPKPTVTPDGCKNCKGRHACEAFQREAYKSADLAEDLGALELPPHALGLELRALKWAQALLDARVSGLESEAVAIIKRGERVPFWSLEATQGRLAWTKPVKEVEALGLMLGVPLTKPDVALITPTQAKAAGVPEGLLAQYSAKPAGAVKLIFDDGTKARLTFSSSAT